MAPPGAPRAWRRVVLKMSGEALALPDPITKDHARATAGVPGEGTEVKVGLQSNDSGTPRETIDANTVRRIANEVAESVEKFGTQLAIVVGGGNIWRGTQGAGEGMDRATSDTMGMLATVVNALALQDAIERAGRPTRVLSAIQMQQVCEPYIRRRAIRHLEKGRVVIFAAGMGNPYFTTDTPAALRAAEIEAEVLMKGTHSGVDGVYSADPKRDSSAVRYDEIDFMEMVRRDLRVMDLTAVTFCMDNHLPILVFDITAPGNIESALAGEEIGTLIK